MKRLDGSAWVARGDRIYGQSVGDRFGRPVEINADGSIIVAGADLGSATGQSAGQVRAFEWNGSAWVQRGSDLNGRAAGNQFGGSVAINGDGSTIMAGAASTIGGGQNAGQLRAYDWVTPPSTLKFWMARSI